MLSDRDSFCVKILKAKYKVGRNWLSANPIKGASWCWKSLEGVKHLLKTGACRLVGSSRDILVWEDPWIPNLPNFVPKPRQELEWIPSMTVSQLLNPSKLGWDFNTLNLWFDDTTILAINNISYKQGLNEDRWIWTKTNNGELSVKSIYKESFEDEDHTESRLVLKRIWKSKLHDRLKMHLWRIASGILPTKDKCLRFNYNQDNCCYLCEVEAETPIHLFWHCQVARALWFESSWGFHTSIPTKGVGVK